jgi:hypothetical protein
MEDTVQKQILEARRLGLEVVGHDDIFGVWVQGYGEAHPLIDDPKHKGEQRDAHA